MVKVNTCGMSCPQPILMTKKALENNPNGADIIVDNNTAKKNVERFLKKFDYKIKIKEEQDTFIISARK
ncbi:sulfurtransferase TusA family protein [Clostridium sp. 'deep sea']|uniref:sulfurtransferase TusA family protein n=1 Tax=Clostridium sp. 'deep sea' TaxID=2779445 RepID=UPI00189667AA|nr:sulfurtransferase TusA family protein [Clostridium sp. 'deep sea']QOR35207.1 sulfurtransferase TusA family protein [Clostridium sp. 'deep sea']